MKPIINKRQSVYFSDTKDKDLIEYLSPLVEHKNFSQIIKELVRDGIKFRNNPNPQNVIQSNTITNNSFSNPLQNIELKQKEVSDDDIESMLDSF